MEFLAFIWSIASLFIFWFVIAIIWKWISMPREGQPTVLVRTDTHFPVPMESIERKEK